MEATMIKKVPRENPTVYTTDLGRICPKCQKPVLECVCKSAARPLKGDGVIRISLQTKGRKGKKVTVMTGFSLDGAELANLSTELKRKCGSGGTYTESAIEIQGDYRDRVFQELTGKGFRVKKVGG
jgi:translation initiation factor 1